MRLLAGVLLGALLVAALASVRAGRALRALKPPTAPQAAATARECEDACEQRAIVEQLADAATRACRARCSVRAGEAEHAAAGSVDGAGWVPRTYHSKARPAEAPAGLPPLRQSKTLPTPSD